MKSGRKRTQNINRGRDWKIKGGKWKMEREREWEWDYYFER
jgi:hypothetical protein